MCWKNVYVINFVFSVLCSSRLNQLCLYYESIILHHCIYLRLSQMARLHQINQEDSALTYRYQILYLLVKLMFVIVTKIAS